MLFRIHSNSSTADPVVASPSLTLRFAPRSHRRCASPHVIPARNRAHLDLQQLWGPPSCAGCSRAVGSVCFVREEKSSCSSERNERAKVVGTAAAPAPPECEANEMERGRRTLRSMSDFDTMVQHLVVFLDDKFLCLSYHFLPSI